MTLQSPSGQTVLEPGVVTIGSTPDSRLIVRGAKVSPHQAELRPTEQGYTITDLWSTEGTFVNEQRLDPLIPWIGTLEPGGITSIIASPVQDSLPAPVNGALLPVR